MSKSNYRMTTEKLKDFIETSKISHKDLCEYIGVGSSTVSQWLSANDMPKYMDVVLDALASNDIDNTQEMYIIKGSMERLKPYLTILEQSRIHVTKIKG